MTISAAHTKAFVNTCIQKKPLYTFTENSEYLVYEVHNEEVLPLWSSRNRLERIQKYQQKYKSYSIVTLEFEEYMQLLKQMKVDQILIGINWSGTKMVGYDIRVEALEKMIEAQT